MLGSLIRKIEQKKLCAFVPLCLLEDLKSFRNKIDLLQDPCMLHEFITEKERWKIY